jgi:tRNA(Ile2) C34 agmatinyltransferase TiaS
MLGQLLERAHDGVHAHGTAACPACGGPLRAEGLEARCEACGTRLF